MNGIGPAAVSLAAVVWAGAWSAGTAVAEPRTWTGTISDDMCGASHDSMAEHGKEGADRDCTVMCVKDGAAYVLVSDGEVLKIANQDFADLEQYAGASVKVTGEMSDGAIVVTAIEAAPPPAGA